jgi:hypothetical protein
MKTFTIENETNNITVHTSVQEAEAVANAEQFSDEAAMAILAADWPAARLVEIWNCLPGVTPVTKFKDRTTGVSRIWKALQTLGEDSEVFAQTEPEGETEGSTTVADITPQSPHVAPVKLAAREDATHTETPTEIAPVDQEKCSELLKVAALAQGEYWDALSQLEQAIGFEIDDPGDLEETSVDDLIGQHETRRKPKERIKATRENSKTSQVIAMLKREGGVTLEEIMAAMGWQKHTTRAMLSAGGSLMKKHGLVITSEKVDEKRIYRIVG